MKKIIITAVAVLSFGFVNAQMGGSDVFEKGNKFLEGSLSLTTGKVIDDRFVITPKFGYMVTDKLAIGLDASISNTKFQTGPYEKDNTYGIGAFARYYFLKLGSEHRLHAYAEAGLGYSNNQFTTVVGGKETTNGIMANVDLGVNYFFTKHWAAVLTLSNILSYNRPDPVNYQFNQDFELNINIFNNILVQPTFGLLYKW